MKHFSFFLVWAKRCHTSFETSWWPLPTVRRDFRRSYSESCGKAVDGEFFVTFCYMYLNVTLPLKHFLLKLICDLKFAQKYPMTYCRDSFPRVTCTFLLFMRFTTNFCCYIQLLFFVAGKSFKEAPFGSIPGKPLPPCNSLRAGEEQNVKCMWNEWLKNPFLPKLIHNSSSWSDKKSYRENENLDCVWIPDLYWRRFFCYFIFPFSYFLSSTLILQTRWSSSKLLCYASYFQLSSR